MVKDALRENAPDERFDKKVIQSLLAKPNLLHVEGHPVRQVLDAIRQALPQFEFVEAEDVVHPPARVTEESLAQAFRVDDGRILSYETTISLLHAVAGRRPPVRLIAAGRSFRAVGETPWHSKAFHQMDALCVECNVSDEKCAALVRRVLGAALGGDDFVPGDVVPLWYAEEYREAVVNTPEGPIPVGGYGGLRPEILAELGYDTNAFGGCAVDFGMDRLAMLRCKIDHVQKLWQPPFIR